MTQLDVLVVGLVCILFVYSRLCSYEVVLIEIVKLWESFDVSSKKAMTKLKHLLLHEDGTEVKLSDSGKDLITTC